MRFINPTLAARTNVAERFHKRSNRTSGTPITECLRHYEILTKPQQPYAFEILDLTAAAAAGVEVRYPFWDKRFAASPTQMSPPPTFWAQTI